MDCGNMLTPTGPTHQKQKPDPVREMIISCVPKCFSATKVEAGFVPPILRLNGRILLCLSYHTTLFIPRCRDVSGMTNAIVTVPSNLESFSNSFSTRRWGSFERGSQSGCWITYSSLLASSTAPSAETPFSNSIGVKREGEANHGTFNSLFARVEPIPMKLHENPQHWRLF